MTVSPETLLTQQYELNHELAVKLDLHDPLVYPPLDTIADKVLPLLQSDKALLVISPTVQTVPLVGTTIRERSIFSAFAQLSNFRSLSKFGIRQWGGFYFRRSIATNSIHDGFLDAPYQVAVLPEGLGHDNANGLVATGMTVATQRKWVEEHNTDLRLSAPLTPMTVGQYLATNALRGALDLPLLDTRLGYTRFPHYPEAGDGFEEKIPAANGGVNYINMQEFNANLAIKAAGIRLITHINQN